LMSAVLILSVCAALMTSCGCKCRSGGDNPEADLSRPATPGLLGADIKLNGGGFAMGEPIVMTLEVTNKADRTVTLTFPTAQRYDFIIKKGKQTIWQWSAGRMFAQVVGRYELAPGDTISYEYTWDQTGADGTKPGLGAYTIEGLLMLSPPFRVGPKTFGIVD
jgi:hypothetical protein